jgi:voltage-gated potassium channel
MASPLERLADALDTESHAPRSRTIRILHVVAVSAGVGAILFASDPRVPPLPYALAGLVIWTLAVLFAAEYAVRLAIAPWAHWAHNDEPWRARRHWALTFTGIVELMGVLPLMLRLVGVPPATAQLAGAIWLLKLVRYAPGLDLLGRVIKNARRTLWGLFLGFVMVLVVAATLEYFLEGRVQPDTFGSIPRALWWAVATLTTVGYGDAVPVTAAGRILASAVMLCGIGICALWTAILVTGFSSEMRRSEFLRTWDLVARVPFFRDLGAETIAEVAKLLRPRDAAGGEIIVRRGEPGDCMYFIASGEVEVALKPAPRVLGAGDFFGEFALITGERRSATVTALTRCELLHLDLADFRHFEAQHPELARRIDSEAQRRRQDAVGEMGPV